MGGTRGGPSYRARLPKCKFFEIAAILAIKTLQRRIIRLWNGNFVGFLEIISKIMKICAMKRNLHFSGKWQNQQICQLLGICEFEIIVLLMEVALVNEYQFAPNMISLAPKLYCAQGVECRNPCFCSKIRSIIKWPLIRLRSKNTIAIQYLHKNKLIFEVRGHNDLKQPRNLKLDFKCAQADSVTCQKNAYYASEEQFSQFLKISPKSQQNSRSIVVLHVSVRFIQPKWQEFENICIQVIAPCIFLLTTN